MNGDVAQNLKEESGELCLGGEDGCVTVFEDDAKLFLFGLLDEEKDGSHRWIPWMKRSSDSRRETLKRVRCLFYFFVSHLEESAFATLRETSVI